MIIGDKYVKLTDDELMDQAKIIYTNILLWMNYISLSSKYTHEEKCKLNAIIYVHGESWRMEREQNIWG